MRNSKHAPGTASSSGETSTVRDDAELLERAGQGDRGAFDELVSRHVRYLYGIAYGLAGNAADAEDLVQGTWVGVLRSRFRGESSVRTWLVRILVRQAAMLRRSRWRVVLPWSARRDSGDAGMREPAVPSAVDGSDARLDLAEMLQTLSAEHRVVIVLRELEGMSYEEIAAELGIPRGTVESRLHRAREQLRKRFRGYL